MRSRLRQVHRRSCSTTWCTRLATAGAGFGHVHVPCIVPCIVRAPAFTSFCRCMCVHDVYGTPCVRRSVH
jgi:hypothetical protein